MRKKMVALIILILFTIMCTGCKNRVARKIRAAITPEDCLRNLGR